jgi:hypothetical protein
MPAEREQRLSSLASYPLLEALIGRRSRRFGKGFHLNGGPLEYMSGHDPQPLTLEEEAALAFAACGVTGYALAELPYQAGSVPDAGGGNIMAHFVARTVNSGDALHTVALFVTNDEGTWLVKRPQDFPRAEIRELAQMAQERKFTELYEKGRVRLAPGRVEIPRRVPYTPPFNKWSANVPGSTYFLPVGDLTPIYINIMLFILGEDTSYFVVDERNRFRPAGLARFARSRGGHLNDDPRSGLAVTIQAVETLVCEAVAIEQGGMLQNLGLTTQALGLGGFTHFAADPAIWLQALGFRMRQVSFSRVGGFGPSTRRLLRLLNKDVPLPTAVGLERDGKALMRAYCPPYYRNMEEAVLAYVDYKYAQGRGTLRDGGEATAWRNGARVQEGIPRYSDRAIEATIAYCEYVHRRYGRFPASSAPYRTLLTFQAHHLDLDFYDRFYRPEAITETQRQHDAMWHSSGS